MQFFLTFPFEYRRNKKKFNPNTQQNRTENWKLKQNNSSVKENCESFNAHNNIYQDFILYSLRFFAVFCSFFLFPFYFFSFLLFFKCLFPVASCLFPETFCLFISIHFSLFLFFFLVSFVIVSLLLFFFLYIGITRWINVLHVTDCIFFPSFFSFVFTDFLRATMNFFFSSFDITVVA